jgi:hypothetical protein
MSPGPAAGRARGAASAPLHGDGYHADVDEVVAEPEPVPA